MKQSFTIYPAIDIRGGKCVRLVQGDYGQETIYADQPVEMAVRFEQAGAKWLHVVDLDGAKAGQPINLQEIKEIARMVELPIQVGGGLRSLQQIEELFAIGVTRAILGTAAIEDRAFVERALEKYSDRIAIGIDAREGYVATRGWLDTSQVRADQLATSLAEVGAKTFIFTDIARDGTMTGPNTKAIISLAQSCGQNVIASGGVSQYEELEYLALHAQEGVSGAIVGKAIYTGAIDLKTAMKQIASLRGVH
jgi:phosphoribosylformimino-5-aminoimidazole carboxamide ribotide isomerase